MKQLRMRWTPPFHNKTISILHLVTFLSSLYFYHQIITLYLQARGLNYVQINSLWGIIVASQAAAEVPTGMLADKLGRKLSIVLALACQLLGEILFLFADSYWLFVMVSVIAGVGFAFLSGCFEAMMYDALKRDGREQEMQKVTGFNAALSQLAIIFGTLTGGFLASSLTMASFLLVIFMTVCSVALALLVSFLLQEPINASAEPEQSSFTLLIDGIELLKSSISLQRIMLLSILATPFLNYLLNLYQPYFLQSQVPGIWLGLALSAASLLGMLSSNYAYLLERYFGVRTGTLIATILPGLLYLLMAAIFRPLPAVLLFVMAYSAMNFQKPLFADYINRHIESRNRATVLSLISMLSGVYIAGMGLLIGVLADISLSLAFLFMGSIILLGAFCFKIDKTHLVPGTEQQSPLDSKRIK